MEASRPPKPKIGEPKIEQGPSMPQWYEEESSGEESNNVDEGRKFADGFAAKQASPVIFSEFDDIRENFPRFKLRMVKDRMKMLEAEAFEFALGDHGPQPTLKMRKKKFLKDL